MVDTGRPACGLGTPELLAGIDPRAGCFTQPLLHELLGFCCARNPPLLRTGAAMYDLLRDISRIRRVILMITRHNNTHSGCIRQDAKQK